MPKFSGHELTLNQSYRFFFSEEPSTTELKERFKAPTGVILDFIFGEAISSFTLNAKRHFRDMKIVLEVENANTGYYEMFSYVPDKAEKKRLKKEIKNYLKKEENSYERV